MLQIIRYPKYILYYMNVKFSSDNIYCQMFEENLKTFDQLPVRDKDRKCTDIFCTVIGAIFALTMFILALCMMNKDNYYKTNFPTDSDGEACSYGPNEQFSYIYFPDINDANTRVCVSSCPSQKDLEIECRKNSKVPSCLAVNIYETSQHFERLGGFCAPTDQSARQKLMENTNLGQKWSFLKTYDVIRLSLIISLLTGIIWMMFTQCIPRIAPIAAVILGCLVLLTAGILLLVDDPKGWEGYEAWRIVIAVFLIVFALFYFVMLFLYGRQIKLCGTLLHHAADFLGKRPINFIFIPLSLLFTVGLIVLCLFQYLAYSSNSQPAEQQNDIYLHSIANTVLTIFNIIQFIWGLQFLKDSFNFMISGNASEWYVRNGVDGNCCTPISRFFKYNFGSVVGGSFLNAFFNFIDFIFESLRCYPQGCCGVCASCCSIFSKCCGCFFDLVRNDAYAYINLTGIPYCNSARNCQQLCNSNRIFVGSQSVMFFYRLLAHTFCVGLSVLLSYWIMEHKLGGIDTGSIVLIIILSYCVVTYFIDIHADAAQGLHISYLTEQQLNGQLINTLADDSNGLKSQMRGYAKNGSDGKC